MLNRIIAAKKASHNTIFYYLLETKPLAVGNSSVLPLRIVTSIIVLSHLGFFLVIRFFRDSGLKGVFGP